MDQNLGLLSWRNQVLGTGIVFWSVLSAPVLAHNIEVTGGVSGAWHVEPDDNPKAGELATVWIALTREGGEIVPLDQATCQLAIYSEPHRPGDQPLLQPPLKPINAEQYQRIPGAEVVFPRTGLYHMELNCSPKTAGFFEPFQMTSEITVATGSNATSAPVPTPLAATSPTAPPQSQAAPAFPRWGVGAIGAAVALVAVFWLNHRRKG
jgi:hypothetical protein